VCFRVVRVCLGVCLDGSFGTRVIVVGRDVLGGGVCCRSMMAEGTVQKFDGPSGEQLVLLFGPVIVVVVLVVRVAVMGGAGWNGCRLFQRSGGVRVAPYRVHHPFVLGGEGGDNSGVRVCSGGAAGVRVVGAVATCESISSCGWWWCALWSEGGDASGGRVWGSYRWEGGCKGACVECFHGVLLLLLCMCQRHTGRFGFGVGVGIDIALDSTNGHSRSAARYRCRAASVASYGSRRIDIHIHIRIRIQIKNVPQPVVIGITLVENFLVLLPHRRPLVVHLR